MTPRSPKPTPKTTTISRRLRSRADQDISVQPPELPQVRTLRARRAAAQHSASTRRISVNYPHRQPEEAQLSVWDPSEILDTFTRSNTSHPSALEETAPSDLLLSQPLELTPYHSPRHSPSGFAPQSTEQETNHYEVTPAPATDLLPSPLPSLAGSHTVGDYDFRLSTEPDHHLQHHHHHRQQESVDLQDMSTLSFMMPLEHYGAPPSLDSPNYPPMHPAPYHDSRQSQHEPPTSAPYAPSYPSSSGLSQSQQRRSGEPPALPPYQPTSVPRSPYQQAPMRGSPTPMTYSPASSEPAPMISTASYSYPPPHPSLPGQTMAPLGNTTSSYPPAPLYPPSSYEMSYSPLPSTMYPPASTAPYSTYEQPSTVGLAPNPPSIAGLSSSPGDRGGNGVMPKLITGRPKPQCWEHGCNGRQFSTFSNLLRHQREKSGTAAKSYCPRCGAEFTRTTARNGHMQHEKCKPRRTSDSGR